jgi:nucleoid-associated protein YgaU
MGKDYRIGLVVGAVLVVIALVWVATGPGLRSRGLPLPTPPSDNPDPRGAVNPALVQDMSPAPEAGRMTADEIGRGESEERRTQDRPADLSPLPSAPAPQEDLTIYERDQPIKTTKFHIVRQGESLSAISQQYYGTPNRWRKILAANSKTIKDANKIAPGTKLIIP